MDCINGASWRSERRSARTTALSRSAALFGGLLLSSLVTPSQAVFDPSVAIAFRTVPHYRTVDEMVGWVDPAVLPGGYTQWKAIVVVRGECNIWWDKTHGMYGYLPNDERAIAQGAGAPIQADGTFILRNWVGSEYDGLATHMAAFILPVGEPLTWPQYVLENWYIHDYIWRNALTWLFVDRSRCAAGTTCQPPLAPVYQPLVPTTPQADPHTGCGQVYPPPPGFITGGPGSGIAFTPTQGLPGWVGGAAVDDAGAGAGAGAGGAGGTVDPAVPATDAETGGVDGGVTGAGGEAVPTVAPPPAAPAASPPADPATTSVPVPAIPGATGTGTGSETDQGAQAPLESGSTEAAATATPSPAATTSSTDSSGGGVRGGLNLGVSDPDIVAAAASAATSAKLGGGLWLQTLGVGSVAGALSLRALLSGDQDAEEEDAGVAASKVTSTGNNGGSSRVAITVAVCLVSLAMGAVLNAAHMA